VGLVIAPPKALHRRGRAFLSLQARLIGVLKAMMSEVRSPRLLLLCDKRRTGFELDRGKAGQVQRTLPHYRTKVIQIAE
jgi:hypothetical protein